MSALMWMKVNLTKMKGNDDRTIEIWQDIPGFDELYAAEYNTGRIRSYDRLQVQKNGRIRLKKGRILKPGKYKGREYAVTCLYDESGNRTMESVHVLVANTFISNPNSLPDVNHKDGDKLNNAGWNLERCTKSGNMKHALETGLSSNKGGTHYKAIKVIDTNTGKTYDTIKQAAKAIGVSNGYLKNMLCGRQRNKTTIKYLEPCS